MSKYYCHRCAIGNGLLKPADPQQLTGSSYQLEKYFKHTAPTTSYNFDTVFTGPSSSSYRSFIVSAVASGHVEVDPKNRINLVWIASAQTGIALEKGVFVGAMDAVKVVLPNDPAKIHGFPIAVSSLSVGTCQACGSSIPL